MNERSNAGTTEQQLMEIMWLPEIRAADDSKNYLHVYEPNNVNHLAILTPIILFARPVRCQPDTALQYNAYSY